MESRRLGLVVITSATLALAACSSSTSGSGSIGANASNGKAVPRAGSSAPPTAGTSSGTSAGASAANTPERLAALLQQGLTSTRSAHIHLSITTGGKTVVGDGDERLAGGKVSALRLSEVIPGAGTLALIQTGGKTYARLPGTPTTPGKPWALVTAGSTNPTIRSLAAGLSSSQSSASVGNAGVFAEAASSIKNLGTTQVAGTTATRYAVVVDTAKLPSTYPGRATLLQAGVRTLPVQLYVDGQGRPVRVTESLTVSGTSAATSVTVSDYNKPVTITAPPASQVSTR